MLPEVPRKITQKSVNFFHAHIGITYSVLLVTLPSSLLLLEMAYLDSFQLDTKILDEGNFKGVINVNSASLDLFSIRERWL